MHPLGDDPAARLTEVERAPLEERSAHYRALHEELLAALTSSARP